MIFLAQCSHHDKNFSLKCHASHAKIGVSVLQQQWAEARMKSNYNRQTRTLWCKTPRGQTIMVFDKTSNKQHRIVEHHF